MMRLPVAVTNLLFVALPTKPFTCTNKTCLRLTWLGSPKTYTRLTPRALDHARTYGKACGWCGHTTTQERKTT